MNIEQARETMAGFCKVGPVCNGKAFAGQIPGMGGTESGHSFIHNVEALQRVRVDMKILYNGVEEPVTKTTLLGEKLAMPVIAAPIGGVRANCTKAVSELAYREALAKGCQAAGILPGFGDGPHEVVWQATVDVMKAYGGIPFIKPWNDDVFLAKLQSLEGTDIKAVGIDLDSLGLSNARMNGGYIPCRTDQQLEALLKQIPYPVIIKGVMTQSEAVQLAEMGVAAIVVSNHGGRIIDYSPGTAEVLPEIAAAVKGKTTILVDGGIQSGMDIYKMLALGADGVLIGRAFARAVFSDLENGLAEYCQTLQAQLAKTMLMTGCHSIADIDSSHIRWAR